MAEHGSKCLEMAGMAGNGLSGQKWPEMAGIARNFWKWLKMAEHG